MRSGRPRLRSGAFAPDFPFVIFVRAYGPSFRFPRAHRGCPLRKPPPRRATRVSVRCAAGPVVREWNLQGRQAAAARAATFGIALLECVATALRAVGDWFSSGSSRWGWGGDGRRGGVLLAHADCLARRPSGAAHSCRTPRIRAARKQRRHLHARASSVHARRRVSFVRPPARPARSGHRPTPPTPLVRHKNAKHTARPSRRQIATDAALRGVGWGTRGV